MKLISAMFVIGMVFICVSFAIAQNGETETTYRTEAEATSIEGVPQAEADTGTIVESDSGNVTLDFKDADIRNVLRILSYKGQVNIIAGKGVEGPITIRLTDVPWEKALDVILTTYDYGYERDGNIVTVYPMEVLTQKKLAQKELSEVEPLVTEVYRLSYVDAFDVRELLKEQVSSRGKITVLQKTVQKGWPFGIGGGKGSSGGVGGFGVQERATEGGGKETKAGIAKEERVLRPRANTLVVSDISSYMERIKKIIVTVDIRPRQVLIETKIVEVNRNKLKDLGFDWGTGSEGASAATIADMLTPFQKSKGGTTLASVGAHNLGAQVQPSIFSPKATGLSGILPFDTGASLVFRKLTGTQFEIILHALEEDVDSNTLSAPRVMTLDGQEAKILIGSSYPILSAEISSSTSSTSITQTLDYYQNLGIVLNVIPQISGEQSINMVLHPAVYSTTESVTATSSTGSVGGEISIAYPIVLMREADTQILMKTGETVVIGGLLKDEKKEGKFSVPILGDLPIVGTLFQRNTTTNEKIDLLIFLTARIIKEGDEAEVGYSIPIITNKEQEKQAKAGEKNVPVKATKAQAPAQTQEGSARGIAGKAEQSAPTTAQPAQVITPAAETQQEIDKESEKIGETGTPAY